MLVAVAAAAAAATVEASRGLIATNGRGADYDPATLITATKQRHRLSAAGNDGLSFSHLQCFLDTTEGKKEFGPEIDSPSRCTIEHPDALPSEVRAMFAAIRCGT